MSEIVLKKGLVLECKKQDWVRKITKIKLSEEEVILANLDPLDERLYTYSMDNVVKLINFGTYKLYKNEKTYNQENLTDGESTEQK